MFDNVDLAQLLTVSGNSAATIAISFMAWKTANASEATRDRYGPMVALLTGIILALFAYLVVTTTAISRADLGGAIWTGVQGGLMASGVYQVIKTKAGTG
jgi:hypothetical protein